jgi:flagellar basal-body rod modification protein FlgD
VIDSVGRADLGKDEFLRLLTEGLKNQDPMNPADGTEFIAQLAQFSSLEQMQTLNAGFESLLALQRLTNGSSLIGQRVTYLDSDTGQIAAGIVTELSVRDGDIHLRIGNKDVPLKSVRTVGGAATIPQ